MSEKPLSEMRIHVVDRQKGSEQKLPNSEGLWTPRWSPDGRSIAALRADSKELLLYDCKTTGWRSLARYPFIESPAWTQDSSQIYFRTAIYGEDQCA